jgi:hypothetical protein
MVRQEQLYHHTPDVYRLRCVRMHDHTLNDLCRARRDKRAPSLGFDHTHTAGRDLVHHFYAGHIHMAERRNLYPDFFCRV